MTCTRPNTEKAAKRCAEIVSKFKTGYSVKGLAKETGLLEWQIQNIIRRAM